MTAGFETPSWVHHGVFYQIFPDRFAFSNRVEKPDHLETWDAPPTIHGFKGGDLLGVMEKLDYLQDLGINAIYFTPVFQSASNHRYHTHDYFQIDPLLGGNGAFSELLREAHRRRIRIILDGVFNHASRGFFQFNHILETGEQSPYLNWFKVRKFPLNAYQGKPNYDCWWNLPALPTFNHQNPQVRNFIFKVARTWVDQGIDGWRLDVPFEIKDASFWQEFRYVVKSANPDAYITGEIPWDASPWLQGDQFDGVMNYLMAYPCWSFFGRQNLSEDLIGHWRGHDPAAFVSDADSFARYVTNLLEKYPRPAVLAQLNLLDSHDTARFLSITGSKNALRLATLFQMTYPGAPCIYYGNEIGMEGGKDPDCRRAFPWNESRWDHELRSYFKQCIRLRMENRVLRDGAWKTLYAANGVVVFLRTLEEKKAVIILNNSERTLHLQLPVAGEIQEGEFFYDAFSQRSGFVRQGILQGLDVSPSHGTVLLN